MQIRKDSKVPGEITNSAFGIKIKKVLYPVVAPDMGLFFKETADKVTSVNSYKKNKKPQSFPSQS
ncbi:hypothetical protein [Cronobacter dublinensis]|uniref:hypothetical protein n=1 Tax=Cronobacter dublinensis TaxID=413497 RepID=UPI00131A2280|nr:hypothetical protein [Cronobacter dublinensis]